MSTLERVIVIDICVSVTIETPGFVKFHLLKTRVKKITQNTFAQDLFWAAVTIIVLLWNKQPACRIHPPIRVEDAEEKQTSRF
jgi:hypothetical protein